MSGLAWWRNGTAHALTIRRMAVRVSWPVRRFFLCSFFQCFLFCFVLFVCFFFIKITKNADIFEPSTFTLYPRHFLPSTLDILSSTLDSRQKPTLASERVISGKRGKKQWRVVKKYVDARCEDTQIPRYLDFAI